MPVPDFQTIMLPLLRHYGDGKEHSVHEALNELAKTFSLSEQEINEMLPSGKQTAFYNRVGWARTYLTKSGLLEMSRRSYYKITPRGKEVLKSNPDRIDMKYLEQFPEYIEFREKEGTRRKSRTDAESGEIAHRIRFMSHTESGACRTVRSEESTGVGIVPQVFGMERTALSFR
jgi:restriction system protein